MDSENHSSLYAKGSYTIITCSVSSFTPVPNQTVYSATKKYVYYFGKALREELLDKDINVLLICPGNMDTEMNPKGQGRQSQKIGKLPFLDISDIGLFVTVTGSGKHESIKEFYRKYSRNVHNIYLMSQKEENLMFKPFYLMPFLI